MLILHLCPRVTQGRTTAACPVGSRGSELIGRGAPALNTRSHRLESTLYQIAPFFRRLPTNPVAKVTNESTVTAWIPSRVFRNYNIHPTTSRRFIEWDGEPAEGRRWHVWSDRASLRRSVRVGDKS